MAKGLAALLVLCSARVATAQHLDNLLDRTITPCSGDGLSESTKLVGAKYLEAAKSAGDPHWSTYKLANDTNNPVPIPNGCPAYYGMNHDEVVHFSVARSTENSVMLVNWEVERWFVIPKISWKTERIQPGDNFDTYLWYSALTHSITWAPWGGWSCGRRTSCWSFFHLGSTPHMGAEDPLVVDLDSSLEGSHPSIYEGHFSFIFHEPGDHMVESDYNVLKQVYMTNCANYRNGTAFDHPWDETWSLSHHVWYEELDYDTAPYCTWMKGTGWNDTYLSENNYAYACQRISNVECDANGRVINMLFNSVGLKGQLPAIIGDLTMLKRFYVPFNQLSGTVPDVFKGHDELLEVTMHHNLLEGNLPCFSGDAKLRRIDLSRNKFTGSLIQANCLAESAELSYLMLGNNDLSGQMPDWSGLHRVVYVDISENHIEGSLPATMCSMLSLETFLSHTNQLVGQLPHACINPVVDQLGWQRMYRMDISHNRFTGSVPTFGANMLNLKLVYLGYNYFEGAVDHQFDVMVEHAEQDALTEVSLSGNYLSGPFPPVVYRMVSQADALWYLYVDDNLFRCENNGRFPPWTTRSYAKAYSIGWLSYTYQHGVCKPVPNPLSVSPTEGEVGSTITVTGRDIQADAQGRCMFYQDSSSVVAYSVAKVKVSSAGADPHFECFVPTSLSGTEASTYKVTIANFGEDFATASYWAGSTTTYNPPSFTVQPVETMESGVVVNTQFNLLGVTESQFNEASFRQMIADIAGVPVTDIQISFTPPSGDARRLQSSLPVYVSINVPVADPNSAEAQNVVNDIKAKLENSAGVEEVMERYSFEAASTNLEVTNAAVEPPVQTLTQTSEKTEDQAAVGIIIAAAAFCLVSCLCGFVCFIRYREKKGQPYFQESLDEGNAGGGNTGASYGNTV
mmetsp:Transcript_45440/g.83123  ORF Transcript_45440/g.83123 Transcript_45440/m.83123 type:complete len:908 (+) Transcript_45440:51-2774(+)